MSSGILRSGTLPASEMLVCDLPGAALSPSFLADPVEAVGRDLGESPPRLQTARIVADLDDVLSFGAPDLARVILVEGIRPDDVPASDSWIEDAQSCAIHGGGCGTLGPDPN